MREIQPEDIRSGFWKQRGPGSPARHWLVACKRRDNLRADVAGAASGGRPWNILQAIRMARKSLTLVSVGPMRMASPMASKNPWLSWAASIRRGSRALTSMHAQSECVRRAPEHRQRHPFHRSHRYRQRYPRCLRFHVERQCEPGAGTSYCALHATPGRIRSDGHRRVRRRCTRGPRDDATAGLPHAGIGSIERCRHG